MDINTVIELGAKISEPGELSGFHIWGTITIVLFIVGVICIFMNLNNSMLVGMGFVIAFSSILVAMCGSLISYNQADKVYEEKVEDWKNYIVKPYIESLPTEKRDVIYIKIESELHPAIKGNRWYISSSEIHRTPLTISFKDEQITTLTDWYDTSMELTSDDEPFVEYKRVPVNLGHGVNAGYYNPIVHLPESYKFSDIK